VEAFKPRATDRTSLKPQVTRLAAIGVAAMVLCAIAHAQTLLTVKLADGSQYQGELIEKVPGDKVVIKLATGEIKTFSWADVVSSAESPSSQPAPSGTSTAPSASPNVAAPPDGSSPAESPNAPPQTETNTPPDTRTSLLLGAATTLPSFPSPIGVAGAVLELDFPWMVGFELASGYDEYVNGGNLGWAVKETVHSLLYPLVGVGVGLSEHFGAAGGGVLLALHAEVNADIRLGNFVIRLATGYAFVFNADAHPDAVGSFGIGSNFFYFDLELLYRIALGPNPQMSSQ
jgi:hypothetical protein